MQPCLFPSFVYSFALLRHPCVARLPLILGNDDRTRTEHWTLSESDECLLLPSFRVQLWFDVRVYGGGGFHALRFGKSGIEFTILLSLLRLS